jgi:glycosyltransferase involved in cell wall biosynthesis
VRTRLRLPVFDSHPITPDAVARKPSLLFVNQHYYPDFASTGQHLTDLAEHLAADGFDVSVLCSRAKYLAGDLDVPKEEVHHGVRIHRVTGTSFGRGTNLGRIADYASFYGQAILRLLGTRRYDYVVTLTTPPLLSFLGGVLKKLRGQRYGIWSMDLHPDAEVAAGMLREEQPLAKLLHALNDFGYRNADFVVDLGTYMKRRLLAKGVRPERLYTIPVWSKKDEIEPLPHAENPLLDQWGLRDKCIVMYSGNAGLAHRFDDVLEAMRRLKDHPELFFLFIGSGPRRKEIEAYAEAHEIENFRYLNYLPREELRYSLSAASIHLLTLRNDMAGIAVPGKLYGIMAAGRPVAMVGPEASEPAQTIQQEEIGFVVDPGRQSVDEAAGQLVEHLEAFCADAALRDAQGTRARASFLEHYEQEVACAQWADLLENV